MSTSSVSRRQLLVMAAATGTTIANIYYAQPILADIGAAFGASAAEVGYLPALSQWGMALGILFIAPLGDMLDRKRLVIALEGMLGLALLVLAGARDLLWASAASLIVGVLTVAVQVVVPMAATLAARHERGKIVGTVFTGTLIGILGSRIVSGVLANWASWRIVYACSAATALVVALLVALTLPSQPGNRRVGYMALLGSTAHQLMRFAELRRLSALGAFIFAAFCCFWTVLSFQLSGPSFQFGSDRIGWFGAIAIGGALAAPWFGRRADRNSPEHAQMVTTALLLLGALAALPGESVVALIIAVFFIEIGVQGTQVNNLAQLYSLDPAAHSRINTVFMTIFFIGGSIGTASGVMAWEAGRWTAASAAVVLWALAALLVAAFHRSASRGAGTATGAPDPSGSLDIHESTY